MKAIRIIYGAEEYLMEQAKKAFMEHWSKELGADTDIHRFTKESPLSAVFESIEGASLFGGGGINIWSDCPYLPIKKGGRSRSKLSKDEELLLDKLQAMPDGNVLLFFTKGNMDAGCAFFKQLKPLADVFKCEAVSEKAVMPYIVDYLKKKGKRLTIPAEQYLHELFQTWDSISLLYVFSELDKLCISIDDGKEGIDVKDLDMLFAGTMEKNLFTFMDAFLYRNGKKAIPLAKGLFSRSDLFLKNSGFIMSRLRLLRSYKELAGRQVGKGQIESIITKIQNGRNAKYVVYHLQKQAAYWKISEIDELIEKIFTLQLTIRRGTATADDMEPLICLYMK